MYSLQVILIRTTDEVICVGNSWPVVTLNHGVSLIPFVQTEFVLLKDGDETTAEEHVNIEFPEWICSRVKAFSVAAYVEAAFWGGEGIQGCCVWRDGQIVNGPIIYSGAINHALECIGLPQPRLILGFFPVGGVGSQDLFSAVGLGKYRSTEEWLKVAK